MRYIKKTSTILVSFIVLMLSLFINATADNSNVYLQNERWISSTMSNVESKYNSGDRFIVVFYRATCSNCKRLGAEVFTSWMNDYSYTIYGVDVDSEGINNWARASAGGGTVSLPLVVFINDKELIALQGASANTVDLLNETFASFIKEESPNETTPTIIVKSDSVYKGSSVTIVVKGTDIPDGYHLALYDLEDNILKHGNRFFINYSFPNEISKSTVLKVKILNVDGITYKDSEENEISERIEITIKNGFFDNIVAFFKWLFKSNEITIAP